MVRAYIIFSGMGPILVVTRMPSGMQSPEAKLYMAGKGIRKYIAFEVSPHRVEKKYGDRFRVAVERLASDTDHKVVDLDGHNVFNNFEFTEMGEPVYVGSGLD